MRGNEAFAQDVINRLQQAYPTWKMNVKHDLDRKRNINPKMYPPMQYPYPNYPPMQTRPPYPYQAPPSSFPASEKIVGQKPCNILVR